MDRQPAWQQMDPVVEQFGRAWAAAADALAAEAASDNPGIPGVQRAMAGAEREFVLAFPKLDSSVAQRFRALVLQSRKLTPRNLVTDGPSLAAQMRDAWLLVEVGKGLTPSPPSHKPKPAAPKRPKYDPEFAAAFGITAEASQPQPTQDDHEGRVSAVVVKTIEPAKPAARKLTPRERVRAVVTSSLTHGLLAAVVGVGLVWSLTQMVPAPRRASPFDPIVGNQGGDNPQGQPGNTRRVLSPVSGLGTDGPLISVAVRPRTGHQAPADWSDPFAVLDWVDQHYAGPTRQSYLDDLVEALRSGDSPWRETGNAGAMADTIAYGLSLTTYGHRLHLLPSEVLFHRGGDPDSLALAFGWVAWRLGLPLEGVVMLTTGGQDRSYLTLDGGFPFGPAPRSGNQSGKGPHLPLVMRCCIFVALRAADDGHSDLAPLVALLEQGAAPRESLSLIANRHLIGRLKASGNTRVPELASHLLALPEGPEQLAMLAGEAHATEVLRLAVEQLGGADAPADWLATLHQHAQDTALSGGRSLTEALALGLLRTEPDSPQAIHLLAQHTANNPDQIDPLFNRLAAQQHNAAASKLAEQLLATGEIQWPIVRVETVRRLEAGDQLGALALLVSTLRVAAAPPAQTPWDDSPSPVPIDFLRQAQALAVSLKQWEHARWLAGVGFSWHPEDRVLWRLWVEVLAGTGDTLAAAAARSRLID